jgi:hypothetical protein
MRTHASFPLVIAVSLSACDDPVVTDSDGTLSVSTSTTGLDPDPDGFQLTIDGVDSLALDPSGTVEIDLSPGRYTLRLLDVASHCAVAPATTLEVDVSATGTTQVSFAVTCSRTGRLVVSTTTEGENPDPDGFHLTIDAVDSLALEPTGTAETTLEPGRHALQLLGVAEHCSVAPEASLEVDIALGSTTAVTFEVTCRPTGVRLTITTTGLDLDPDGYHLLLDGGFRENVAPNTTQLPRLAPGSRTFALADLAPNCAVDGPDSRTVTVVPGELVNVEFAVVCTATTGVIGVGLNGTVEGAFFDATLDDTTRFQVVGGGPGHLAGVPAGDHVVSIQGPSNCRIRTGPQSVTVTVGTLIRDTAEVAFSATCETALRVTAPTMGTAPEGEYSVWSCEDIFDNCYWGPEDRLGALAPNDTLIAEVRPGSYYVYLRDLPDNCVAFGGNPMRDITVLAGQSVGVAFLVSCS